MPKHLHIDLARLSFDSLPVEGNDIARGGRCLIAKALLEGGIAGVDPLSPDNPLIFAGGPFAGTTFSNGNRLSVGCKSPLTGGIKEANSGGTFAVALGQLGLTAVTLHGACADWVVIHLGRDGAVSFDSAAAYLGKGNDEAARLLIEAYGGKVSVALCGPVGEYQGLLAGIGITDREGRPSRLAARGGVGAVMGSKRVKAIVADLDKMPPMRDRKKFFDAARVYAGKLGEQPPVQNMRRVGTAGMADFLNYVGGLPVRNFSAGRLVEPGMPLPVGGEFLRERVVARGGDPEHACMSGCVIKCSNVYVDASGKELVSPLEYETLGLLGTNCGLSEPDDIARLNAAANDLGVDTIELGATLGILLDGGQAPFGDVDFLMAALEDLRQGTERGRLLAQGTARVGEHYGILRVPVVKKQAISAYDPRVIEVTAISMMTSPQGADHTAGNVAMMECKGKTLQDLAAASATAQINSAISDSLGLCIFGRTATDPNYELLAQAINDFHGTTVDAAFIAGIGRDTLRMERAFNRLAGFTAEDDRLPAFFCDEPLPPTGKTARLHDEDVGGYIRDLLEC